MKYLVVTPWGGNNEEYLRECIQSVKDSSGDLDVVHAVIECDHTWEETVFDLRNEADFVAYVDADDVVYGNALQKVFNALEFSDAAMAFTREALTDSTSRNAVIRPLASTLADIQDSPSICHHLVAFRRGCIDDEPLRLYRKFANFREKNRGCPLDWLMRARAAMQGFIPIDFVGYGYRQHRDGITSDTQFLSHLTTVMPHVVKEIKAWSRL